MDEMIQPVYGPPEWFDNEPFVPMKPIDRSENGKRKLIERLIGKKKKATALDSPADDGEDELFAETNDLPANSIKGIGE